MDKFFTNAFENMPPEAKESFYKTVFMNDDSEYANEVRLKYWKSKLKYLGDNVTIGKNLQITNPEYVSIGSGAIICDDVTIIARGPLGVELAEGAVLKDRVFLDTEIKSSGYIKIGYQAYIGTGTTIFGHCGVEIGDNALMAQNISLTPFSHKYEDPDKLIIKQGGKSKKVVIGRDSYTGMNVTIMYTGDIGEGSVVGSGSVVVKPIPPYSVAVGNPARVIKKRELPPSDGE